MTPLATALTTAQETAPATASAEYRQDLAGSRAANTIKAYAAWAARFDTWRGQEPAQAAADGELAAYLRALEAAGKAPASIAQAAAAIAYRARVNGQPNSKGPQTQAALERIRRQRQDRGRGQSAALTLEDVGAMLNAARQAAPYGRGTESPARQETRSRRDAAMLGLLFYAGMRRSEAAAVTAADVQTAQDAPGCAVVAVRRSKTNPDGSAADMRLVKNSAAAALLELAADAQGSESPLLGIGPDQIANRVKALAKAAGIAGRITAHSARIGLASELTRRGASTTETMLAGGWKTARMVAHYSAGATAERGAVAKYL
ncbi:tyrosine-type recombinase/integrase [Candidatus Foliamicus sp.]